MRIEHIAMYVTDLEDARKFFTKYFNAVSNKGYHNPDTDFRSYFLSFDNGARLEIMNRPNILANRDNIPQMGYAHMAFSLGSKEAVDKLTDLLRNDGYEILSGPRTTGDGYYESCIIAFEDNLIELTI
ncbi:MAG: VOC family protein [Oscillospiraceae bacterium]|nr:VOC family protein [Oscillospiraceae bacterium]